MSFYYFKDHHTSNEWIEPIRADFVSYTDRANRRHEHGSGGVGEGRVHNLGHQLSMPTWRRPNPSGNVAKPAYAEQGW